MRQSITNTLSAALLTLATGCTGATGTDATSASTVHGAAPASEEAQPQKQPVMTTQATGLYGLETTSLEGTSVDLAEYAGKVTLVVNVASRCGYTRQYAGLQELHEELSDQGFAVLGFPSNEFGGQEPGTAEEILAFCSSKFDVKFPLFAKCEVKPGAGQSPVYGFLQQQTSEVPGWNFCKYLVGKDGQVIAFYPSGVEPDADELRQAIEDAIG